MKLEGFGRIINIISTSGKNLIANLWRMSNMNRTLAKPWPMSCQFTIIVNNVLLWFNQCNDLSTYYKRQCK